MAQVVFEASSYGGVQNLNANYYTCRNATTGDQTSALPGVGQAFIANYYRTYRGFIFFDTSGLPDDALITSATIKIGEFAQVGYHADIPFNVILRSGDNTGASIDVGDYDLTLYGGDNLGELTTKPASGAQYLNYTLNDLGLAHIKKTGTTKFVLLSEEDIDNSPPGGGELNEEYVVYNYTPANTITITYFLPTGPPTVETIDDECEDRLSTTLTAVGEITDIGGGYTYRGFEYHQYDPEYDSSMYAVREIGRFTTPCIYRMTLYGLKPLTCYWIRAFAGNVFGISYGDWVICCTIAGSPSTYDVYTEPNTAKYRLYVSDDEAIAWRGYKGPYSGKQTLINIKDITNLTKGMKVLKIDLPDANTKGNFHICITVKQTLKG